ncbi:MAG: type III PLP-dependent enzyme [Sedimentisphaerales bacterium]|nr:type III PLP-dependent enzyme [Sedimentisphaerales bacterium]
MKRKPATLAKQHGTPLFIIDHDILRRNYRLFRSRLPRIQAYYAVKANSQQEIVKTLFDAGASFDVASYSEFMQVYRHLRSFRRKDKDFYIWDKIIFANTIKDIATLRKIRRYRPLVTFDNAEEIDKIKAHCDKAGLVLRLKVPDTGSACELSSKFGAEPADAADLIDKAESLGLTVEGLSFHVGSQCTNFDNYIAALNITAEIFHEARSSGRAMNIIDIGGGFPAPYDPTAPRLTRLAKIINAECDRLFPKEVEIIAEPGRFIVATAAMLVTEIIGKASREGKTVYHINDGVYQSFSGVVFDHWTPNFQAFRAGPAEVCSVVGPTCDSFDKITLAAQLPGNLRIGDYLLTENIGAYSIASATNFNGFGPPKVIHINN